MGNKSKRILRKIIVKFCEEFIAFRRYDEGETVKSTICTCNANGNATQQQLKLMTKAT